MLSPLWLSAKSSSTVIESVALAGTTPDNAKTLPERSMSVHPSRETSEAPPLPSVTDSLSASGPTGSGSAATMGAPQSHCGFKLLKKNDLCD